MATENQLMEQAIEMAVDNVRAGRGGPFAALVVRDGKVIARGTNQVTSTNDPTAHAEIRAIRTACSRLDTFELDDCVLYSTCEPCPMCLGAIYWARLESVVYASTHQEASAAGFDDTFIYEELSRPVEQRELPMRRLMSREAQRVFDAWRKYEDRVEY